MGLNMRLLETQLSILKMKAHESSIAFVSSMIDLFSEIATVLVKLILVMPAANVFE